MYFTVIKMENKLFANPIIWFNFFLLFEAGSWLKLFRHDCVNSKLVAIRVFIGFNQLTTIRLILDATGLLSCSGKQLVPYENIVSYEW